MQPRAPFLTSPILLLVAALACSPGCSKPSSAAAPKASAQEQASALPTHPRGRWRLLTHYKLGRVVLWVSHILIRHDGDHPPMGGMLRLSWQQYPTPAGRSKAEALSLALQLAEKINHKQASFSDLALRHSEDLATARRGGRLGGTRANQLNPRVLDAARTIEHGQATVIESAQGFHVVTTHEPPAEQQIAGQHVVIRYAGSVNWQQLGHSTRSREQALALAREIAASSEPFGELVRRYSEHGDRLRGGDMGVWSARAPRYNGPEIEVLAGLKLGEVSAPLDTRHGFQVIKRVPVTERETYAVRATAIRVGPASAQGRRSASDRAKREAIALARRLAANPDELARMEPVYWAGERTTAKWRVGTREASLEAVVGPLAIGEVATTPVDMVGYFIIPQRLDPSTVPDEPPLQFELPEPNAPDLNAIFRNSLGPEVVDEVERFRVALKGGLPGLPNEQLPHIDAALQQLQQGLRKAGCGEERVAAKDRVLAELELRLGKEGAGSFESFLNAWATRRAMASVR